MKEFSWIVLIELWLRSNIFRDFCCLNEDSNTFWIELSDRSRDSKLLSSLSSLWRSPSKLRFKCRFLRPDSPWNEKLVMIFILFVVKFKLIKLLSPLKTPAGISFMLLYIKFNSFSWPSPLKQSGLKLLIKFHSRLISVNLSRSWKAKAGNDSISFFSNLRSVKFVSPLKVKLVTSFILLDPNDSLFSIFKFSNARSSIFSIFPLPKNIFLRFFWFLNVSLWTLFNELVFRNITSNFSIFSINSGVKSTTLFASKSR